MTRTRFTSGRRRETEIARLRTKGPRALEPPGVEAAVEARGVRLRALAGRDEALPRKMQMAVALWRAADLEGSGLAGVAVLESELVARDGQVDRGCEARASGVRTASEL